MSSPTTTPNPLLASTEHIGKSESIAWIAIYAMFTLFLVWRNITLRGHRFVYILLCLFAALRTASFGLRYAVSQTDVTASNTSGLVIGAAVLLIAGFYLLIEAVMDLIFNWFLIVTSKTMPSKHILISHLLRHLALVGISIIGIIGATTQSSASSSSSSDFTTGRALRIASGVLFILVAVGLIVAVPIVVIMASRASTYENNPVNTSGKIRIMPTAVVLFILSLCVLVEAIYRIWSGAVYTGFIVTETAIDGLIVVPEIVLLVIVCLVDFTDLRSLRVRNLGRGGVVGEERSSSLAKV